MKSRHVVLFVTLFMLTSVCISADISVPDYVSNLVLESGKSRLVNHNLGTEVLLIDVMFRSEKNSRWSSLNRVYGIWYEIVDSRSLEVFNKAISSPEDLEFRVMIWKVDETISENQKEKSPTYFTSKETELSKPPFVMGYSKSQAVAMLESESWKYKVLPEEPAEGEVLGRKIVMQIPKPTEDVVKSETVVKLILEVKADKVYRKEETVNNEGPCIISGRVKGQSRMVKEVALFDADDKKTPVMITAVSSDGSFEFPEVSGGSYRLKVIPKSRKLLKVTPQSRKISCQGEPIEDVDFFIAGEL